MIVFRIVHYKAFHQGKSGTKNQFPWTVVLFLCINNMELICVMKNSIRLISCHQHLQNYSFDWVSHSNLFCLEIRDNQLRNISYFFRILVTKTTPSKTKCALECNEHEQCRSFNFCGGQICELNKEDVYSTQEGEAILQNYDNCEYFGMKKTSSPICSKTSGNLVDIQTEDKNSSVCPSSAKSVDTVWGPWELSATTVETEFEKKVFISRQKLIESAHGGLHNAMDSSNVKLISWLKFNYKPKTFEDAKSFCSDLGGELFSNVDGSKEQLRYLVLKLAASVWTGIGSFLFLKVNS